jgi:hypothetical protein
MARVTAKLLPGPALAQLEALKRQRVVIGVLGSEAATQHGDATNADVASWMEFGTTDAAGNTHVPERSFLRSTLQLKAGDIRRFVEGRVRLVMSGKLDAASAYEAIGLKVRAFVQGPIRAGIPPDLEVREGIPLINTGQLIGSITHETRPK